MRIFQGNNPKTGNISFSMPAMSLFDEHPFVIDNKTAKTLDLGLYPKLLYTDWLHNDYLF